MQVTITINVENYPRFFPAPQLEVSRILLKLAETVSRSASLKDLDDLPLRDGDAHLVGQVTIEPTEAR